jgi:Tfp pilus assembly protein PilF
VLLFVWLQQVTGATWRSALVAALFAWHPLHVESVAWAAERKDVLCAFFWILTLMAYAQYARRKTESDKSEANPNFYYGLSLVLFALALMSKPMAVTLPCVLLLLDFWPLQRISFFPTNNPIATEHADSSIEQRRLLKSLILEKVPFGILALAASIVAFKVQDAGGAMSSLVHAPLGFRFENAFVAYLRYISKSFWPTNLAVLYPLSSHLPTVLVAVAVLLFLSICIAAFWLAPRAPYLLSGWFWFAGTLVPVIGIVQVGGQSMADRYTYIPSIGFFIVLVWGAGELLSKAPKVRNAVAGVAAVVLVGCFGLARQQLGFWLNGETVFRHAIAVTDRNYLAYSWLATSLDEEGRSVEAIQAAAESVRMQPDFPEGHYNLGTLLLDGGKTDEAIQQFEIALKQCPRYADAENNLGKAYQTQGKLDEAAAHLARALSYNTKDPELLYNLGSVLMMQSKLPEAAAYFLEAIRIMPEYADAHGNLGVILMRMGHPQEGSAEFAEKVRLKPKDPEARLNYGLSLLDQNQPAEAAAQFDEALRLKPDSALGQYRLGLALANQGKPQEAIVHCREALKLQPDFPEAREKLAEWTGATN